MTPAWRFHAAAALQSFAIAMVWFAIPVRAAQLGAADLQLGVFVGAAPALVYAVLCVAAGGPVHRFGPKPLVYAGCAAIAAAFGALAVAGTVWAIAILASVLMAFVSLYWPGLMAWLSHGRTPEELERVFPVYNLCWGAGAVVAPAVGGLLLGTFHAAPFLAAAAFALVPIAVLAPAANVRAPAAAPAPEADGGARARDRILWSVALGANFAVMALQGLALTFLPKLGLSLGMSPAAIGAFFFAHNGAQTAVFGLLRASPAWRGRLASAMAAQLAAAAAVAGMAWGRSAAAFAATSVVLGAASGLAYTLSLYYSLQAGQGGRGSALHEANLAAGHVAGPLLGGLLAWAAADHGGLRVPFAAAAGVLLAVTCAQLIVLPDRLDAAEEAA